MSVRLSVYPSVCLSVKIIIYIYTSTRRLPSFPPACNAKNSLLEQEERARHACEAKNARRYLFHIQGSQKPRTLQRSQDVTSNLRIIRNDTTGMSVPPPRICTFQNARPIGIYVRQMVLPVMLGSHRGSSPYIYMSVPTSVPMPTDKADARACWWRRRLTSPKSCTGAKLHSNTRTARDRDLRCPVQSSPVK